MKPDRDITVTFESQFGSAVLTRTEICEELGWDFDRFQTVVDGTATPEDVTSFEWAMAALALGTSKENPFEYLE